MKKINISHIEKHLFDENKYGWDRNQYPLVQIKDVKVIKVINARPHKSLSNILSFKRHIGG